MSKRPNALAKAIKKPDPNPAQANSEPAAHVKNALAVKTPSAAAAAAPAEQATPAVVLPPVSSGKGRRHHRLRLSLIQEKGQPC